MNRLHASLLIIAGVSLAVISHAEGPNESPVLTLSLDGAKPGAILELSAAGALGCQAMVATLNAVFAVSNAGRFVYGCTTETGPKGSTRSVRLMATKGGRSDLVGRSYGRKVCDPLALVLTAAAEDARSGIVFSCEGQGVRK